jgi:hypothetical protein
MIVRVYYKELEDYFMDTWGRNICYFRVECSKDRFTSTFPMKDNKLPVDFDTENYFRIHGITNTTPGIPEDPMYATIDEILHWRRSKKIKAILGQ